MELRKFIATTIREYLNENVNTIETLEQTSKRMFNKSVSELSDDEYYQASDENAKMHKVDTTDILPKIKQIANKKTDFLKLSMENLEYIKSFYDGDGGYHESGTNNI